MHTTLFSSFGIFVSQHQFLGYIFSYIATIFFGNIAAFTSFWLAFQGVFGDWGILGMVCVVFIAEATSDIFWYGLGRALSHSKLGNWLKMKFKILEKIENLVERKGKRAIILSKFFYGATYPVMFGAGWARLNFGTFFRTSLLATLVWLPAILLLSYGLASSLTYFGAAVVFKKVERLLIVGIILFIAVEALLSWIARKFLPKSIENQKK